MEEYLTPLEEAAIRNHPDIETLSKLRCCLFENALTEVGCAQLYMDLAMVAKRQTSGVGEITLVVPSDEDSPWIAGMKPGEGAPYLALQYDMVLNEAGFTLQSSRFIMPDYCFDNPEDDPAFTGTSVIVLDRTAIRPLEEET